MAEVAELRERALRALQSPAPYGPDVDLERYLSSRRGAAAGTVEDALEKLGLGRSVLGRAGYVQVNEEILRSIVARRLEQQGVLVMPLHEALEKLPWARGYYWRAVPVDADKYTAAVELYGGRKGYFIYVPPGARVEQPIYTCLLITEELEAQLVHNIVVVDEGAEANLVSGCGVSHGVTGALHVGVSEFYVKKGATLRYAMIHSWAPGVHVRPRTGVVVEEDGSYVNYYLIHGPVASVQSYPVVELQRGARLYSASIIVAEGDAVYDIGALARLRGQGASAELVSRVLARGSARVYARSRIEAHAPDTRGHIECLGLPLSGDAVIESIPELHSSVEGAELTHEAAIGRIAEEELEYLMSRGFTEDEARGLLLRGLLHVEVPGLPAPLRSLIRYVERTLAEKATG